jgi:hypothetical protein
MNAERVRSVLGVWAPMVIGLFIIVTSVSFYFTATLTGNVLTGDLEPWRLICSAGAFFVGGLLIFSTYGRYTKTKEWRLKGSPDASLPPPSPSRNEKSDHEGDPDDEKD